MSKLDDELDKIASNRDFDNASKHLGEASRDLHRSQLDMFNKLQLHAKAVARHAEAISLICDFLIKAFEDRR